METINSRLPSVSCLCTPIERNGTQREKDSDTHGDSDRKIVTEKQRQTGADRETVTDSDGQRERERRERVWV